MRVSVTMVQIQMFKCATERENHMDIIEQRDCSCAPRLYATMSKEKKTFAPVVSLDPVTNGIGRNSELPWRVKEDMAFFKELTTSAPCGMRNAVIMGRKTWESIPMKFRPLENRLNVILSRNAHIRSELSIPETVLIAQSLPEAMALLETEATIAQVFIIGGELLYREAVSSPLCAHMYVTEISRNDHTPFPPMDTFFPIINANRFFLQKKSKKQVSSSDKNLSYRFVEYHVVDDDDEEAGQDREFSHSTLIAASLPTSPPVTVHQRNMEEWQYLQLVKEIIEEGVLRGDRTGTGTLSKFGVQMRFSLRNNVLPLITTKRVFWRGVAEELLWFVKGSTNAKELQEKNIHIWDGNASRQFLDSRGLHDREEGDLGPVYGFQWRHFGAKYVNMHHDYTGQGIDQLADCIHKIKNAPEDRRILMSAWNPADLHLMALPPCHMFCQFYVANGEVSCHMYQRSADMGLGVPFNIASYALLTRMVAHVCGLKAGDFVHSIGDAHVYVNHVEALKTQLLREPKPFPTLTLNAPVEMTDIDGFKFQDFVIENYHPDAAIKMDMAV